MIVEVNIDSILFLDIETVPGHPEFKSLDETTKSFWEKKCDIQKKRMPERYIDLSIDEVYAEEAGIFAEFGKIICISVGMTTTQAGVKHFRVKSYSDDDEHKLLGEFASMLHILTQKQHALNICGHNIKEFDIPYIARRMLLNEISLPSILNIAGKRPWEVRFLDTLELWKFGDFKSYSSLSLLCHVFGVPTPKDDIDGSQVAKVYYKEHDLDRIARYCEKDVIATAQLFLKMNGSDLIQDQNIEYV